MIYQYKCPSCSKVLELDRRVKDHSKAVYCPSCDIIMPQLIRGPYISVKEHSGFNNGLGIRIKDKNSIKDEIKKINDTTGRKLEEVGTSSAKVQEKQHNYDFTSSEKRHIGQVLHG